MSPSRNWTAINQKKAKGLPAFRSYTPKLTKQEREEALAILRFGYEYEAGRLSTPDILLRGY